MRASTPRAAAAALISLALAFVPRPAAAHDKLGALLNGIADFRRNHEFADVVKQSRKFLKLGQFDDQDEANLAPIGPDGWPTTDFRLLAMAGQQATQNLAGAYAIAFTGQADLAVGGGGGGTITGKTFDAGTNTTRATLDFPAGAENMIVDFTNTGGAVKNLRIVRPGLDPDAPPLLTPAWTSHAGRFSILRFMDWTRTNGNRHVAWADRTTPEKLRTETWIAQWETVIDAANALGRDAWINIPVQANDEYVTNLATLVRDRLAPNLAVYVEYGNELWNFSIRDVDLDNAAGTFFNGATVNADLAEASPPDSPLRFDGESDKFILGFRRVALRLAQVSDIFKAVWGPAAIKTRVRPVLAGQMANSFIVSEGLRLIDEGLGRRPDTVIYAISGAPYVFPAAIPDGEADEVPGLTKDQILDGLAAGVANAPNENAYQYLTHAAMAAWYGVKVVAYEFGFDNFGAQNVAAKRAANLDPRIRGICRDFLDQWHAFGFDHALWFSAGADSYDTPFGMWPLVEDMANQATPKNQCMDDILAAPLPAITIGSPAAGGAIAGGSYRGGANPAGPVTGLDGPFGFPGFVEYLVRADTAGAYTVVFNGSAPPGESFRVKLNNATVAAGVTLPASAGNSVAIPVTLRKGLNALRLERVTGASWSIASFSFALVAAADPPRGDVNGDGKADLYWREAAPGQGLSWWTMNGNAATAANYHEVGSEWQVADVGDLDGDGKADLVWRRTPDGAAYLWTLDGFAFKGFFDLGILPPAEWSLVGAADLDGDGKDDLVWRNVDGTVYGWLMNGGAIASQGVMGNPGAEWAIVDMADANGDGKADLVFRNAASGQVFTWFMNGLAIAGGGSPGGLPVAEWNLLASADFDGDGRADLLWRSTAGDTWVWLMNGAAFVSGASIGNPGLDWTIRSVADLDGDGKSDLVWRRTDGTTFLWKMNGAVVSAFQPIANPGGSWQVVAP